MGPLFVFIFGTIVGSFLNVIIHRYATGESILGRSQCVACGAKLSPHELIPLISFIAVRGRCAHCKARVSARYFWVEAITGVFFLLSYLDFPFAKGAMFSIEVAVPFFILSVIWSVLIVLAFYDLNHKILPDFFTFLFAAISFLWVSLEIAAGTRGSYDLLAGPALFLFFFLFWFMSGGRVMGLGDAKLAFGMGIFLGIDLGISALLFAFWIGAVVSVLLLIFQKLLGRNPLSAGEKPITMKSEISFGPFLILGTALAFFLDLDILHLAAFL